MEALDHYLTAARDAVTLAQQLSLEYFSRFQTLGAERKVSTDMKTHNSLVTEADKACEKVIRDHLKNIYPTHTFFGEEEGRSEGSSNFVRYIDPIDGTREFIRGTDDRGILVALFEGNEPIVAISCMPVYDETLTAIKGGGTRHNDTRLMVSSNDALKNAYIAHERHKYFQRDKQFDAYLALCDTVEYYKTKKLRDFHYLVQGKIDAVIGPKSHLYDIAPFILMTQEAGGRVTTLSGTEISDSYTSYCMSNGKVHQDIIRFFA